MNNLLLLVARVLIALLFLMTVVFGSPNPGYVGSLGFPSPTLFSWIAIAAEWLIVLSLIFGVVTRYGALLGVVYVIIATAAAHRYWEYPQAQQLAQYTNFTKNLAILGALILVFVAGPGELSIDRVWSRKRATD